MTGLPGHKVAPPLVVQPIDNGHGRVTQPSRYALGSVMTSAALLVGTVDICIPSMIYRSIFGWPRRREPHPKADRHAA